jgi:MarR family transcriptional regulator for hemolysin
MSNNLSIMRDEVPVGRALGITGKQIAARFEEKLQAVGGSIPCWVALDILMAGQALSQRDLAKMLHIEGPTLTHHLDRLEAQGWLERRPDPSDRRVVRVYATASGRRLHTKMERIALAWNDELTNGVTEQELAAFRTTLSRLRANIDLPPLDAVLAGAGRAGGH